MAIVVRCLVYCDGISFIAESLLRQDELSRENIDALRQIDYSLAANVLSDRLLHPDPKISTRASQALALLSGEEAVRTLQAQRTKALDTYTKLLGTADAQIMDQFKNLMKRAQIAFSVCMQCDNIVRGEPEISSAASRRQHAAYLATISKGNIAAP